jgi:hypothetical protein
LADFIYQAAAAVVDLADDELDRQAKMRATGYEGQLIRAIRRAEAAEAKAARVEKTLHTWSTGPWIGKPVVRDLLSAIRAALDDPA